MSTYERRNEEIEDVLQAVREYWMENRTLRFAQVVDRVVQVQRFSDDEDVIQMCEELKERT